MSKKNFDKTRKPSPVTPRHPEPHIEFALGKENFILIAASFFLVFTGFILMYGTENIYGFVHITLAPVVVVAGFILGIFAILKKSKN